MAAVVSDTTPLHYLILADLEFILEKLYRRVYVPPEVLTELGHASAPLQISRWAANPPTWLIVAAPQNIPERFQGLDLGERQALALALEITADLILLDDKVARRVARSELIKVKGTLGVVADAARANLLDFAEAVEKLRRTNIHLHQDLIAQVVQEYERTKPDKRDG